MAILKEPSILPSKLFQSVGMSDATAYRLDLLELTVCGRGLVGIKLMFDGTIEFQI